MRASVLKTRLARLTSVGLFAVGLSLAGLSGCAANPAPPSAPPAVPPSSVPHEPPGEDVRCHTAQLSAHLGTPGPLKAGLRAIPLVYTNTSDRDCQLHGAPSVELHGPDDPNGPVFAMSTLDTGASTVTLHPGSSATATIVIREDSPGRTGHGGSTGWTPITLISTPPGETDSLSTPWSVGGTVLREDSSTHPDEYAEPFEPR